MITAIEIIGASFVAFCIVGYCLIVAKMMDRTQ